MDVAKACRRGRRAVAVDRGGVYLRLRTTSCHLVANWWSAVNEKENGGRSAAICLRLFGESCMRLMSWSITTVQQTESRSTGGETSLARVWSCSRGTSSLSPQVHRLDATYLVPNACTRYTQFYCTYLLSKLDSITSRTFDPSVSLRSQVEWVVFQRKKFIKVPRLRRFARASLYPWTRYETLRCTRSFSLKLPTHTSFVYQEVDNGVIQEGGNASSASIFLRPVDQRSLSANSLSFVSREIEA